ncbi:POLY protein, partial [Orthonyx spaldingii]|nr:POLY protein [Orthonyx spaldingii]
ILQTFPTPPGVQITQYVDNLLLSGETEVEVREATIRLLNFLGEKGLRASKGKLQFVESEVKYLGHLISKGSRRLSPERIAGILSLPPPSSKKEIRKLL